MTTMPSQEENDAFLSDLWRRRFELDEGEMSALCIMVHGILAKYAKKRKNMKAFSESHEHYINGFILEKILQPKGKGDYLHAGGLCLMYSNYLMDQLRADKRRKNIYSYEAEIDGEVMEYGIPVEGRDFSGGTLNSGNSKFCGVDISGVSETTVLGEVNLTVELVSSSARSWLLGCDRWVPVYLAHNFCADKEMSEPLVHLASRYGIASYHYKAQKLGINWDYAKARKSGEKFSHTLIGEWLTKELGIPLDAEHEPVIKIAFNLLCLEALYWGEHAEVTP